MDFKLLPMTVLFCVFMSTTRANAYYAPLQDHVSCADHLFTLSSEATACSQIDSTLSCMRTLISGKNSGPVCDDEDPYEYCGMLDGSMSAPMAGDTHPSLCSTYVRVVACNEKECGPRFVTSRPFRGWSTSEKSCPKLAKALCVDPVQDISEINKDTCIALEEAKACFVDKLFDCGGIDSEQFAVDIILAGLVEHVNQCQDRGFGSTANDQEKGFGSTTNNPTSDNPGGQGQGVRCQSIGVVGTILAVICMSILARKVIQL